MYVWEPAMTWPELRTAAARKADTEPALEPSLIRALFRVRKALTDLDGTDPESDSLAYDAATDRLVDEVRCLVSNASPVLAVPGALSEALREAIADHRDLTQWCRGCDEDESGVCKPHRDDLTKADLWETLMPTLDHDDGHQPSSDRD